MEPSAAPSVTTRDSEPTVDQPASEIPPLVGPQLRSNERYHIMGEYGRGGLGRVSRAHDLELGRDVAIKELISRDHVNEVRFLREALITARLEHPGIVPIHEAGRWPDGTPYYAMKLVSGRSLRTLISECTTADERLGLLDHVIAVTEAIAYAHRLDIIHRDLKPANVIVGEFGETIVIDWGLAKYVGGKDVIGKDVGPKDVTGEDGVAGSPDPSPEHDLTSVGSVLGTPAYMAPEQARGEHVDQRADVFAIGTMLWELCVTRRKPPASPEARQRLLRRAGIDRDLATIIGKALDPAPAHRYGDAGALAADLKAFKSGARIAARSYSMWATLTHWTRRHRVLALSVSAAIALATTGIVLYVRNIASERDRADAAAVTAAQERDNAKLSQASMLLEKDPTRARSLLADLPLRTPLHALLTSRARLLSAQRVVSMSGRIEAVFRGPDSATVEVRTRPGELYRLDPGTGEFAILDRDLTGAIAYRGGQWLYARKPARSSTIQLSSPLNASAFDAGDLTSASQIAVLSDAVYVVDATGALRRVDGKTSAVVERGVRNIAGDGELLIVCKNNGELDIKRRDAVVAHRQCPAIKTAPMAVVNDDYAVLTSDGTLVASRHGQPLEIRTGIHGECELALSSQGLIAIADYSGTGKTWFVRPDGRALEPGPVHAAQPFSLATDGNFVAWGYTDGTVIALDAVAATEWRLRGHPGPVVSIAIDSANTRVVTATSHELRVWDIKPPASSFVRTMPCPIFRMQPSPDGARVALDCGDGSVWVWSRNSTAITHIHRHVGPSFGVEWVRGRICSGGWSDGHVLCSNPDGTQTQTIPSGTDRISWLTATPDHQSLIFTSGDGKIWQLDAKLHELYSYNGVPQRMSVSGNGYLLAACAPDGTIEVYDLTNHRLVSHKMAHVRGATSVSWVGDELWTGGNDGAIKRWAVKDGDIVLRHSVQMPTALRLLKVVRGGWAANVGEGVLLISVDGSSISVRLDIGKNIEALDISPDLRYVAAGVNGEVVVIDLQRNAVATVTIGAPSAQHVSFLDATTLAFSEPAALKTLRVDRMDYVVFQAASEALNNATF